MLAGSNANANGNSASSRGPPRTTGHETETNPMSDKAEARHEISKLIYAYSEALDGGDLAQVGDILQHAAIRVPANGIEARGREAIQKMFEEYTIFYDAEGPADPYAEGTHPHTCHFVANLVIEVDDDLRHAHS